MKKIFFIFALMIGCASGNSVNNQAESSDVQPLPTMPEAAPTSNLPPDSICSAYQGYTCIAPVVTLPANSTSE
jgi:hypothetical protein